jgi:hypothetical protein
MSIILHPPRSRESLTDSLEILGRARRLACLARATARLALVLLLPMLLFTLADVLWHLPNVVRALGLVLTLMAAAWTFHRQWLAAWRLRTDPLAVALALEEQHPQLQDTLASAVTFLQRHDPDKPEVPQRFATAVIRAARRWYERYDSPSWIPSGAAWREIWLVVFVLAAASVLVLLDSQRAAVAFRRFVDPYGVHPWPPQTRIEIVEPQVLPTRLARGESWTMVFLVHGLLPEQAEVEIRLPSGEQWLECYPLARDPVRGTSAPVSVPWQGQRFSQTYQFRIRANDSTTPWHTVTIVPPPQFVALGGRPSPQFRLVPPAYTGLPEGDLPDAAAVLEVPAGSILYLRARVDTPLSDARLVYLGDQTHHSLLTPLRGLQVGTPALLPPVFSLHASLADDIPLQLHEEGTVIQGCFQPAFSGTYAWKLTDATGLTSTRLLEIRLLPDPAPHVVLLRPHADSDAQWYVPTAQLPLHVTATDPRYGLRRIALEYSWEGENILHTWDLVDWARLRQVSSALCSPLPFARPFRTFHDEQRVPLPQLRHADGRPPQPGDILHLRIVAWDWDDVTPCKPPGRHKPAAATGEASAPTSDIPSGTPPSWDFTLMIVTDDTLLAIVQRELTALLPESLRLREQHKEAQEQMQGYAAQPKDESQEASNRERLLRVEQGQRLLRGRLEDPQEGLRRRVLRLQTLVQTNALPPSPTTQRLQAIADLLQRLTEQEVPSLDNRLRELREAAGGKLQPPASVAERLLALRQQQRVVQEQLQALVELLSEWSGAADVRSAARLLQQQLLQQAAELQRLGEQVPAGQTPAQLPAELQAELQRRAARLDAAAEQAEALLSRAARLAQTKETEAEQARSAAAAARQRASDILQQAHQLPPDSPQRSFLQAQAAVEQTLAQERLRQAELAAQEAAALRQAIQAAQGQSTAEDLRQAARALRNNRQVQAAQHTRQAAERLERLITALKEQTPDPIPELARLRAAADGLDALGTAQDELRRRTQEAAQLSDPAQRTAELQRLARQQAQLQEQTQQLLQRLQRQGQPEVLQALQEAIDQMTAAQQALQQGQPALAEQVQSIERLDEARDRLDAAVLAQSPTERLADEKRRQLRDRLQALLERQRSRIAEAQRLHNLLLAQKRWTRTLQQGYAALAEDQKQLAEDVRPLAEELSHWPVLEHLLRDTSELLERAAGRIHQRLDDLDPDLPWNAQAESAAQQRLVQPMEQAAHRLEQLLLALQDESGSPSPPASARSATARPPSTPSDPAASQGEMISPLAQLKALRAWQAEIHQRTTAFAQNHPDLSRLSDADREELQELEAAQRTIATLFQKLAALLNESAAQPGEASPALPVAPPPRPVPPPLPQPSDTPNTQQGAADDPTSSLVTPMRKATPPDHHLMAVMTGWDHCRIETWLAYHVLEAAAVGANPLVESVSPESEENASQGSDDDAADPVEVAPPPRPLGPDGSPESRPATETPPTAETPEDPSEILQRIIRNAQKASQELAQANPGPQTQQTQRDILKDIDALLRPPPPPPPKDQTQKNQDQSQKDPPPKPTQDSPKDSPKGGNQEPPHPPMKKDNPSGNHSSSTPMPKGGNPPPQGGTSPSPSGSGGKSSSGSAQEQPGTSPSFARRPRQGSSSPRPDTQTSRTPSSPSGGKNPMPMAQKIDAEPKTPGGSARPDPQKKPLAPSRTAPPNWEQDWVRNVWGHLPDTLRRQASEYYRQELIPKYTKLLEQYYSSRLQKK